MPTRGTETRLDETRYVTLILRLVLDGRGTVIRGELVDADDGLAHRFLGWRGLTDGLRTHLAGLSVDKPPGQQSGPPA